MLAAMLTFFGSPAFTSSRLSKRLARVQKSNPNVTDLDARYVHFVDVAQELNSDQTLVLERLLQYGPKLSPHSLNGSKVLVTPRLGTISSWSSKATDIAHICGLHAINRIERAIEWTISGEITNQADLLAVLHDRMTETVLFDSAHAEKLFHKEQPKKLTHITLGSDGKVSLQTANKSMGLALSDDEIDYLLDLYSTLGRDPTDVELMMFAQANSEHCRHKIFNAEFTIDGEQQGDSLFRMIRRSTEASPRGVLSAYKDNAAVIEGPIAGRFFADPKTGVYATHEEPIHILMKVETHNHPTAISPHPGASTGSGGEIRDEGATGIGAKPKAGLVGFSVSNLHLPEGAEPWEAPFAKPNRIASALDIMLEGPIGAAAFNNEFGRPAICGYFRTYELLPPSTESNQANTVRGYHKPIMIAGGLGNIRNEHVQKGEIPVGAAIVVLGGPAMLIGLGGGAASSMASGSSHEDLDFASVQRDNAEMQRRSQEVIDRCWALGHDTPIASIHDVGAGGLSNALPELVHESRRGALFDLRKIPSDEPGMSPLEIWCNEAQERYVLAVFPDKLAIFEQFCKRERAPFAVLGHATNDGLLKVEDHLLSDTPIQMPLQSLLGKPPRMKRNVTRQKSPDVALNREKIELKEALVRVLRLPTVADKTFLITIGDRTVTGLVHRDPMVGPWQVPVADTAVTATSYDTFRGEAMAMGERPPVALLDAAASARMAVAEAITNICAAKIASIGDIKLSANWMAPAGHPGEDARLYEAVKAVGSELCPALGIAIPVGKDSMSMKTVWADSNNQTRSVVAPLSLIVSAFAPVSDIRKTLTPQCRVNEPNRLMLIDLGQGKNRLGASCLAQVYQQLGTDPPDLDSPDLLKNFFMAIQQLNDEGYLLAYHDRADGGLLSTLTEMAFASNAGLDIVIDSLGNDHLAALFSEELGAVIQVREKDAKVVIDRLSQKGLGHCVHSIGSVTQGQRIQLRANNSSILDCTRTELRQAWSHVTYKMQALRDNPECAEQEHLLRLNIEDTGIFSQLTFNPDEDTTAQFTHMTSRPRVAILREQGVNGHIEMAAAFDRAGFESVDVHMTDILEGRVTLDSFRGLVACGGFSYGDVLGAGEGWAKSILFNQRARQMFKEFFERENTFSLGVCNGCQMFSALKEIVPGTTHWPRFVRNRSEQFEARLVMVKMQKSPSLFFKNMEGSVLPIPVAHGEGLTEYANETQQKALEEAGLVAARYVDHSGSPTELYPRNPNGSAGGITAICNESGRVTILMPHPERVFRAVQYSWHPQTWKEDGPWMRMFRNARAWVG